MVSIDVDVKIEYEVCNMDYFVFCVILYNLNDITMFLYKIR